MSFAALALSLAIAPPAGPPAPACASTRPEAGLAGSWTGAFAGADWTFVFERTDRGWTGRYRSSRGTTWHPLLGLVVTGGCVAFSIESTPQVSYALALGDGDTLAGTIDVLGHRSLPFSATRNR